MRHIAPDHGAVPPPPTNHPQPSKLAPPLPAPLTSSNPMIADPAIIAQAQALADSAGDAKVTALLPITPGFLATSFCESFITSLTSLSHASKISGRQQANPDRHVYTHSCSHGTDKCPFMSCSCYCNSCPCQGRRGSLKWTLLLLCMAHPSSSGRHGDR